MGVQLLTYTRAIPVIVTPSPDAVDIPNPALFTVSGTDTSGVSFALRDVAVNFNALGVRPGDIVYNTTFGFGFGALAAYVVENIDPNTVGLSAEIFSVGNTYSIYQGAQNDASKGGCVIMTTGTTDITVVTLGGDAVLFANVPSGSILPVQVRQVIGNTGPQLIGLW
jgi:hypothetical protein